MSLLPILALAALLLGLRAANISTRPAIRQWLVLLLSIIGIYWLSPTMPIRQLDFWLPTASIVVCYWVWLWSIPATVPHWHKHTFITLAAVAGVVILLSLTRYLPADLQLLANRPPDPVRVLLVLLGSGLLGWLSVRWNSAARFAAAAVWVIVLLLFALKLAPTAQAAASGLRFALQQNPAAALPTDIRWLGFSYLAFRLIHVLRERLTNPRWQAVTLAEMLSFALFLPAWSAGPIDKLPRFVQELRQAAPNRWANAIAGCQRLAIGIGKKFGLAAMLGIFALNESFATQVQHPLWLWLMLFAYGGYLYCDFSGYSDIAIGLGQLLDIRLPENFGSGTQHPYRQGNLTQFWNQWHNSLSQWFRAYYFNPLSKALRQWQLPTAAMIAIAQISTMLLIGIWHGVTWNFAIWGLWHGIGLFLHNRWVDYCRQKQWAFGQQRAIGTLFTIGTLVYVNIGWLWFALPTPASSWLVLRRLFGLG